MRIALSTAITVVPATALAAAVALSVPAPIRAPASKAQPAIGR